MRVILAAGNLTARGELLPSALGQSVVELFHGDDTIAVVVEAPHQHVLFVVGHIDAHSKREC